MRRTKFSYMSLLLLLALFACSPQTAPPVGDPVAETLAAMDLEATHNAFELQKTAQAEAELAATETAEKVSPFGLFTLNCPVTVAENLVYDTEQIKITVKSLGCESFSDPQLLFWVENNTQTALSLRALDLQINGFMMTGVFDASVPAQSQSMVALRLAYDALEAAGVETIQYFEFNLGIDESQNWSQSITTERIRVNTNADPASTLAIDREYTLLAEREGIRIYLYRHENPAQDTDVRFYIIVENNTDIDIALTALDLKINDHECESSYETQVLAGLKSVEELSLPENQLAINDIERVDRLVFRLQVMRKDTGTLIFNTDLIELVFEQP